MKRIFSGFLYLFLLFFWGNGYDVLYAKVKKHRHRKVGIKKRQLPYRLDQSAAIPEEMWERFFLRYFPENKFNGAVIVAQNDQILYERYSGWQDKEKGIQVTDQTAFHVASVSKTFTSAAILKLVQEGKMSLDDKVTQYLPYFLYTDIRIQDLLTHRSGLKTYNHFMYSFVSPSVIRDTFLTNKDILYVLNTHPKTKFSQAGKRFVYSNSNYALLALVIEAVTNKTYKAFMEEDIFKPLGLNDTHVFSIEDTADCTPSYDINFRREKYRFLDAVVGDKGIYTTALDLLKWDKVLKEDTFLDREMLEAAFRPYSLERKGHQNYGLGWRLDTVEKFDKQIVYHFGWWHGNRAVFLRDLKNDLTVIILSNKFTRNIYRIKDLITSYDVL